MRSRMLFLAMTACGSSIAAPIDYAPTIDVAPVTELCVTHGSIANRTIAEPTVRAFALGAGGDAAELAFTYRGDSQSGRALANGQLRRQVGLKLRAANSCNVVYVMWRLDPKPKLDVSVKSNPGMRTHDDCGANGYLKVKPQRAARIEPFETGRAHTLRAEIVGDELTAWIDGHVAWHGALPLEARGLVGPAGIRSDNVALDNVALSAPRGHGPNPACKPSERED
ncbi:MAG TPA: hypothetical protein VIA18_03435 [Polyangia bacterium]|nr:hypothetical protein [Polyangia bacterium]